MKMKKNIFKLLILIILLVIGLVTAQLINMDLNLSQETKDKLLTVGSGISDVEKTRELYDENGTNYANETYIDVLKLIPKGCGGGFCFFKLYESEGINKEFKVELEKKCKEEGLCNDMGEIYECCLEWRSETDEEVLAKAEIESKKILNHIASVTEQREESRTERFEEIEIRI